MSEKRTYKEIRNAHTATEGDYELLRGDTQRVREKAYMWSTQKVLEEYVGETDQLIGIIDGSISSKLAIEIRDESFAEDEPVTPDTVLYLDKSARPVEWFVDAFWEQFARPNAQKPKSEFLNIDRVNWFVHIGYDEDEAKSRLGPEHFDLSKVQQSRIDGIRALFVDGDLSEEDWREEVWNLPTRLDNESVLIVDEVKNRGGTLAIAAQLLKAAIPEAKVSATYFWHTGRYAIGNDAEGVNQQAESAPVWYDKDNPMGRSVGDISLGFWDHQYKIEPSQENLKRKIGNFALSAPHHDSATYELVEKDKRADRLRQDIAYLTYAVADGSVIRRPSRNRSVAERISIYKAQGFNDEDMRTLNRGGQ